MYPCHTIILLLSQTRAAASHERSSSCYKVWESLQNFPQYSLAVLNGAEISLTLMISTTRSIPLCSCSSPSPGTQQLGQPSKTFLCLAKALEEDARIVLHRAGDTRELLWRNVGQANEELPIAEYNCEFGNISQCSVFTNLLYYLDELYLLGIICVCLACGSGP